jgi:hypothetical protein
MRTPATLVACVALLAMGCRGGSTTSKTQARVRNKPPASCTQAEVARCAGQVIESCPADTELVVDYGRDCCARQSCQPKCVAPAPCQVTPAPDCPAGSDLWVGTSLSDCCPAYRCVSQGACTNPGYRSDGVACRTTPPDCGPGIMAVEVGEDADCCPIWQCQCVPQEGLMAESAVCGCVAIVCPDGTDRVCAGEDSCGGPCECVPQVANCLSDADCGDYRRCVISPAVAGARLECSGSAACPDGTACIDGACVPSSCADASSSCDAGGAPSLMGVCVAVTVSSGCAYSSDCPPGQECQINCAGGGCNATTDGAPCGVCASDDPSCSCYADGSCDFASDCFGECVAVGGSSCADVASPASCPPAAVACEVPMQTGELDSKTCCPTITCSCSLDPSTPCPAQACGNAVQVGMLLDCCPDWCCPDTGDWRCATPG